MIFVPAQATATATATAPLPGEHLTIDQTLRVMDVARSLRDDRETAQKLYRVDSVRKNLRDKLMRTAALSGDRVSESEIDAAIDQYLASLHRYEPPGPGLKRMMATAWVWRNALIAAAVGAGTIGGALWFF